jgi:GMP synthase-like glutamine amidotransferase
MNVLAVVHGDDAPPGSFGDVVRERGHSLDAWAIDSKPRRPLTEHDAVMLFGGAMHADQEAHHPWLRDEDAFIRGLLERGTPLLGVCLGAQLVAKAAGARVAPATEPEIGWCEVERTGDDPVLDVLPQRFPSFQWHYYAFEIPSGGRELARSPVCPQAFRLGEAAWGVQFHPEVTREIVARWVDESPDDAPAGLPAETDERIDEWVKLGRALCGAFLDKAERPQNGLSAARRFSS